MRQNESRAASLGYIVENGGVITDAISTQVWSGDAAVHVSIVNWEKASPQIPGSALVPSAGEGILHSRTSTDIPPASDASPAPDAAESSFRRNAETSVRNARAPRTCRLAFQHGDSVDSPWETFEVARINSSLSLGTDVSGALVLAANAAAKKCFTGQNPVNAGFFLTPADAAEMLRADPRNREVVWPYMIGRDLVEDYAPTRWIIDFAKRDLFAAKSYALPFAHVREHVEGRSELHLRHRLRHLPLAAVAGEKAATRRGRRRRGAARTPPRDHDATPLLPARPLPHPRRARREPAALDAAGHAAFITAVAIAAPHCA